MRVAEKIRELVEVCSLEMHGNRRRALLAAVVALVQCGRVVAASMGRALATRTSEKHGIKRMDRLLGNRALHRALHRERLGAYERLASLTVSTTVHPIVLVDWSLTDPRTLGRGSSRVRRGRRHGAAQGRP